MARTLSLRRHPTERGCWIIKHGNTIIAGFCQPNLDVTLGKVPTAQEVRDVVKEVAPGYGVTDSTPVRIVV